MKNTLLLFLCMLVFSCQQSSDNTTESIPVVDSVSIVNALLDALSIQIERDSLNGALYFERAQIHLKNKSLMPGSLDLKRAVRLDSTNPYYWQKLGNLEYAMKNSRFAKNAWEECARLDPSNLDCRLDLAEIYLAVGELKKGQQKIDEVLRVDNKNAEALYLSGNFALFAQDTVKALQYIQAAINQKQDFFKAFDLMGVLFSAKGDAMALDYFNSALRIRPYRFDIHYKVGMFYQNIGAYKEAIQAYKRALEINPSHKTSLHNIGVVQVFLGEPKAALGFFSKAIEVDDMYLEAYFGRAYVYELLNDFINSESDYRTTLMIDPSYRPAMDGLVRIEK